MARMVKPGDMQQIQALSRKYKRLFDLKEKFLQEVLQQGLTAWQYAECEKSLALITGELKATDAKIHYLMFGGELQHDEPSKPLLWQAKKLLSNERLFNEELKKDNKTYDEKRLNYLEKICRNQRIKNRELHKEQYFLKQKIRQLKTQRYERGLEM